MVPQTHEQKWAHLTKARNSWVCLYTKTKINPKQFKSPIPRVVGSQEFYHGKNGYSTRFFPQTPPLFKGKILSSKPKKILFNSSPCTVGVLAFLIVMLDAFFAFSVNWTLFLRTRTIGSNVRRRHSICMNFSFIKPFS